jgi:GDPmannose 4,6-dehydratase
MNINNLIMKKKKAIIFGVTGQDGYYLTNLLLEKNYIIHGVKRRSSSVPTLRINSLLNKRNFNIHYGDLTDTSSIYNLIKKINPDEIYNLAAQSHVGVSFYTPIFTANVNAIGVLSILESIKTINKEIKFYQAGTSEMFGKTINKYQSEKTNFNPQSPYGAAKVFAHQITQNYRDAYNIFASNGILFNHESPLRGENFVTKKIVKSLYRIKKGKQKKMILGNLYSRRDWGHAADYVIAIHKILQQNKPGDFVIATGRQHTIKEFVNKTAKIIDLKIKWKGKGLKEIGVDEDGNTIVEIDKKYFRPLEVDYLKGDASKAKKILKWKPKISLDQLIKEMIEYENNED